MPKRTTAQSPFPDQPAESESQEEPELRFALDPRAMEARGVEAATVLGSRLCEASRAKIKSPQTAQKMQFADLRKLIRQNCHDDPEFLSPNLPVVETAFRVLLIAPKEPVPLSVLHDQIARIWSESSWPRHISAESLARVLLHDTYYGVVGVKSEEKA